MELKDAATYLIIFIVAATLIVTGATVFESLQESSVHSGSDAFTGVANNTMLNLSVETDDYIGSQVITVTNNTLNTSTTTLTGTYPGITVSFNTANVSGVTITYDYGDAAYEGAESALEGANNLTNLMPALGVVLAIVVLLSVLFMVWKPSGGGL